MTFGRGRTQRGLGRVLWTPSTEHGNTMALMFPLPFGIGVTTTFTFSGGWAGDAASTARGG